jgi:hypothetical protein
MILQALVLISPVWMVVACTMNSTTTGPISSAPTATPVTSNPTVTPTPYTLTFLYNNYISVPIGNSTQCSSCHTTSANGTWDPSSKSNFYNTVVNQTVSSCGTDYIVPNNTSQSSLYNHLSGSSCDGGQMPQGGPTYLTAAQLAQWASWINSGAPNN